MSDNEAEKIQDQREDWRTINNIVYVAAPGWMQEDAKRIADVLQEKGYKVNSSWLTRDISTLCDQRLMPEGAAIDMQEVAHADWFVCLVPLTPDGSKGQGNHTELEWHSLMVTSSQSSDPEPISFIIFRRYAST